MMDRGRERGRHTYLRHSICPFAATWPQISSKKNPCLCAYLNIIKQKRRYRKKETEQKTKEETIKWGGRTEAEEREREGGLEEEREGGG